MTIASASISIVDTLAARCQADLLPVLDIASGIGNHYPTAGCALVAQPLSILPFTLERNDVLNWHRFADMETCTQRSEHLSRRAGAAGRHRKPGSPSEY